MKPETLHYDENASCTEMLRGGSRSFFAASRLLSRRVREPATALYAFCRVADDAIDHAPDPAAALADLARRLDAIYAGRPHPFVADQAFAPVVREFGIPRELPEALLEGFAWDAAGRRYHTLDQVLDYAARVAGTVGAMMALIMGVRAPGTLARACELGLAMQLTNIARDVGEDARSGRVYLPLDWLEEVGLDTEAWLAEPHPSPELAEVTRRLLDAAEICYRRAEVGIADLPASCRPAMMAARRIYADIGRQIVSSGCDSVSRRAVVPGRRKLALLFGCLPAVLAQPPVHERHAAAMPAVRFLVQAVIEAPAHRRTPASFLERTVAVIELFERLAERDRAQRRFGGVRAAR